MSRTSFINTVSPKSFSNFGFFLSGVFAGIWKSHMEIEDYEAGLILKTDKINVFYDLTGKNDGYIQHIN